jgi:hypothetical protein
MSKLLCNYAERTLQKTLNCKITGTGCKYMSYCTQDHLYWCNGKYYNCERRMEEMGKNPNYKKDKKYNNRYNTEFMFKNTEIEEKPEVVETEIVEETIDTKAVEVETTPVIEATPVEVVEKPKEVVVPTPKKTVRRKGRIIY